MNNFVERGKVFTLYHFGKGNNYIFNRRIFQTISFLFLLFFIAAWAADDFGNIRLMNFKISCPGVNSLTGLSGLPCPNPFYNLYDYSNIVPLSIIESEFLPAGFVYDKNNFFADNFINFMVSLLVFAFCFNHIFYNESFSFKKAYVYMTSSDTLKCAVSRGK